MNERTRHEILSWREEVLTPHAMQQFKQIQNKCNGAGSNAMDITVIDADKGIETARYVVENSHTGMLISIDLSKFHCSCFNWHQFGIPCKHVYNYMAITGISTGMFSEENKFFLPVCYTERWRQFYDHASMRGNMPGDQDVELFLTTFIRKFPILTAKLTLPKDDTHSITKKRLRGGVETASKGSIAPNAVKRRIKCATCGKTIAASTKHGWQACQTYKEQHNILPEEEVVDGDANNLRNAFDLSPNETEVLINDDIFLSCDL